MNKITVWVVYCEGHKIVFDNDWEAWEALRALHDDEQFASIYCKVMNIEEFNNLKEFTGF